jgi:undecaprenyl diphosphate synthase
MRFCRRRNCCGPVSVLGVALDKWMIKQRHTTLIEEAGPPRPRFSRIPRHVGIIPDGNRRWAKARGLDPGEGYAAGVVQGIRMLDECSDLGIQEVSVYGFTQDNTHRPTDQRIKFSEACSSFAEQAVRRDVSIMVLGNADSPMFPEHLRPYANTRIGNGKLKINMLVNYDWEWDMETAIRKSKDNPSAPFRSLLASADVSRIELLIRWGGCRRLSGFLPVQTVYSDFYVVDKFWPDFEPEQAFDALRWYGKQDITLGG